MRDASNKYLCVTEGRQWFDDFERVWKEVGGQYTLVDTEQEKLCQVSRDEKFQRFWPQFSHVFLANSLMQILRHYNR